MPHYKLTYFDTPGRAETIRFIFAQAGVEYEDCRLPRDEWPEFKPTTPYGSLPVLEVDGKMLAGSASIARYLAEEFGLAGSNAFENADIASIGDVIEDLSKPMLAVYVEKDEAKRTALQKSASEEAVPRYLRSLEKRAMGNNCMRGWIYGPNVTYADLAVYLIIHYIKQLFPGVMDKFPALNKLCTSVSELPNIAKWLEKRPLQ